MKLIKIVAILGLGFGLSACGNFETTTRNAPLEFPSVQAQVVVPSFNVTDVTVRVPDTLKVSEAELYYPLGDIVWRGEPIGDRYEQVKSIFETSARHAGQKLDGVVPVVMDIEVMRFHALTNKARYTIGGVHSMRFTLTLRDPETGAVLMPPQVIEADLKAYGGQKAILADRRGQTQKVRITGHLAQVFENALTAPPQESAPIVAVIDEKRSGPQI